MGEGVRLKACTLARVPLLVLVLYSQRFNRFQAVHGGRLPQASGAWWTDADTQLHMPGSHAALRAAPKQTMGHGELQHGQVPILMNNKRRSLHRSTKNSSSSALGSHESNGLGNVIDSLRAAGGGEAVASVFRLHGSKLKNAKALEGLQPSDLLLVLPISVARLPLARAHRSYTQPLGMATVIVLNANKQQLELLNAEGEHIFYSSNACTHLITTHACHQAAKQRAFDALSILAHPVFCFLALFCT